LHYSAELTFASIAGEPKGKASNLLRPPNTQSLNALIGGEIEAPTYAELSEVEIDRLIIKCRTAIASHRQDSLSRDAGTAETALVAVDGVKAVLRDILAVAPSQKRAKIEALIENS
jgi:hypothetical protein